jgi:hypothetical protein
MLPCIRQPKGLPRSPVTGTACWHSIQIIGITDQLTHHPAASAPDKPAQDSCDAAAGIWAGLWAYRLLQQCCSGEAVCREQQLQAADRLWLSCWLQRPGADWTATSSQPVPWLQQRDKCQGQQTFARCMGSRPAAYTAGEAAFEHGRCPWAAVAQCGGAGASYSTWFWVPAPVSSWWPRFAKDTTHARGGASGVLACSSHATART